MLSKQGLVILTACAILSSTVGCDKIGQTSAPSTEEVKANFDKKPLEERAKSMMMSPAPMETKMANIKAMYEKEGQQMPADLASKLGGSATAH